MINVKFSCLLTHQHPQSTIPVGFEVSAPTKFRTLRDYFHLTTLRKTWSCQEAQQTILSLSEQITSFQRRILKSSSRKNRIYRLNLEVPTGTSQLCTRSHSSSTALENLSPPNLCPMDTDFYNERFTSTQTKSF